MYILFIKKHEIGIPNGDVRKVSERLALKMIDEGYAEEINKETYEEVLAKLLVSNGKKIKKAGEDAVKRNLKESEESAKRFDVLNKNKPKIGTVKKEVPKDERVFHEVTEGDIENNPEFKQRGVKAGDEILLDKDGNPVKSSDDGSYYGREGVLGKHLPSSED